MQNWLNQQQEKIDSMGLMELLDYKQTVINSVVENNIKFFLYDIIDERLLALNITEAIAVSDETAFKED